MSKSVININIKVKNGVVTLVEPLSNEKISQIKLDGHSIYSIGLLNYHNKMLNYNTKGVKLDKKNGYEPRNDQSTVWLKKFNIIAETIEDDFDVRNGNILEKQIADYISKNIDSNALFSLKFGKDGDRLISSNENASFFKGEIDGMFSDGKVIEIKTVIADKVKRYKDEDDQIVQRDKNGFPILKKNGEGRNVFKKGKDGLAANDKSTFERYGTKKTDKKTSIVSKKFEGFFFPVKKLSNLYQAMLYKYLFNNDVIFYVCFYNVNDIKKGLENIKFNFEDNYSTPLKNYSDDHINLIAGVEFNFKQDMLDENTKADKVGIYNFFVSESIPKAIEWYNKYILTQTSPLLSKKDLILLEEKMCTEEVEW